MNYYERHIGDYLKDTAHLSLLQHGIYTRLMDVYYTREGPLPDSAAMRLIGARSKDERAAAAAVLAEFFTRTGDAWRQGRCDAEIARYRDKQEKARRSAEARWSQCGRNANASRSGDAKEMRTHSEGNALQSPDTKPNTSEANASGAGAPPDHSDVIFALGIPLLTAANVSDRNARSMLGLMRKTHGDEAVIAAVQRCAVEKPLQPVAWLQATLKSESPTKPRKSDALMAGNIAAAHRYLEGATP